MIVAASVALAIGALMVFCVAMFADLIIDAQRRIDARQD